MTLPKWLIEWLIEEDAAIIVESRRGPPTIDRKYTVIIGTSGSTDYLRDAAPDQYRPTRQDRRFWPVTVPRGESTSDDTQSCDGLHDATAPIQHQCSRCFPDRGDLAEPQEDEYDEARRDDDQEME